MFGELFTPTHLLVVLGIALLVFGPKRLPELGKGLGASIRDFKDAISGKDDKQPPAQLEARHDAATPPPQAPSAAQQTPAAPRVDDSSNPR